MYKQIAVVLARGASTRVPRKNLIKVCGKPLFHYTLDEIYRSHALIDVAVMTEDNEVVDSVLSYNRQHGRTIAILSERDRSQNPVFRKLHTCLKVEEDYIGMRYERVIALNGDCPIRPPGLISDIIAILEETGCDAVESVIPVPITYHPNRICTIKRTGDLLQGIPHLDAEEYSQYYAPMYVVTGAGFGMTRECLAQAGWKGLRHTSNHVRPLVCDPKLVHEIDTYDDLAVFRKRLEDAKAD